MASEVKGEDEGLSNAGEQEQHNDDEVSTSPSRTCSPTSLNSTKWLLDDLVAIHQETKPANNIDETSIGVASMDSVDNEENGKEPEESDKDKLKENDEEIAMLKHELKESKEKYEESTKEKDEVIFNLQREHEESLKQQEKAMKEKDEVIFNLQREREESLKQQEKATKSLVLLYQRKLKDKDKVIANTRFQHEIEADINEWRETVKDEVIANLERKLEECQRELKETLVEYGRILVENDSVIDGTFKSNVVNVSSTSSGAAQLPQADEASTSDAAMQTVEVNSLSNVEIQPAAPVVQELPLNDVVNISVQESGEESSGSVRVRLTYVPSTAVERHIYNNYKLLVLTISGVLLSSEVEKFKEWARNKYGVDLSSSVYEGFLELDRKCIISASDLTNLKDCFVNLLRFDVVHLIDCFLQGNYGYLKRSVSSRENNHPSRNTPIGGLVAGGARNSGSSQGDEVEESLVTGGAAHNQYVIDANPSPQDSDDHDDVTTEKLDHGEE